MKTGQTWLTRHVDALITLGLFLGYSGLLLGTAGTLGFTRDEGFYFAASRAYAQWFDLLWHSPSQALARTAIDHYWSINHEHPGLIKALFALSNRWFSGVFPQPSTSFRLPSVLLSSLAVVVTFSWGRQRLGRAGGLVAALSFAFMPHVFFHAHLACFDLPVCALWLLTSYAYARSLESPGRGWALCTGVVYGLLLDTKHNAWLFPFALLLHFVLTQGLPLLRDLRDGAAWWRRVPSAWGAMLVVSPLLFIALWPWLWYDPWDRFREYVAFHAGHDYYNMEFLGHTHWKPPMPRGYAWFMTVATVPFVTLFLGAAGATKAWRKDSRRTDFCLWATAICVSYAPWLLTTTPIFGGTKHWLTAYPFLCLFAGFGFTQVVEAVRSLSSRFAHPALLGACVLAGPAVMSLHAHPFGLSAYTPLVGGTSGAATLGLNRTFWGYTTQSLAPFINRNAKPGGSVYVHDTALQSFAMFQEDGRLRPDLRGSLDIAASDLALYHHEPHMSRVEHQIWLEYGSVAPDAVATFDGVPIAWLYARRVGPR